MEVNDLKKQYNIILGRMKKGMKCCEELDITKKEDKVRLERYTDKIIELLDEGDKILFKIEQHEIRVTANEVNNGFEIEEGLL